MRAKRRKRNNWVRQHTRDSYVRRAQADAYRSRAVYKLEEIDRRDRLLRPGMNVVELGAAPGGWSQYVQARIRPNGTLVAVDILDMAPIAGVVVIHGDINNRQTQDRIIRCLPNGRADLVISDMAPNITGIRDADQSRALVLLETSLALARKLLVAKGNLVLKLFEGEGAQDFRHHCAAYFEHCVIRKPAASRPRSREIYLVAKGLIQAPAGR